MQNRRTIVLAPLGAVAAMLAFASLAYACTTIIGTITTKDAAGNICPNSASEGTLCQYSIGDTFTSTGNSLAGSPDSTQWGLYFLRYESNQDSMETCMGTLLAGEQKMGTTSEVEGADDSVTISGEIPPERLLEPSGTGPAHVCLISENTLTDEPNYRWGTPSTALALL